MIARFLPICLFAAAASAGQSAPEAGAAKPVTCRQVEQSRRELWRASIDAPQGDRERPALQEAIRQVLLAQRPGCPQAVARRVTTRPASRPAATQPATQPANEPIGQERSPVTAEPAGIPAKVLGRLRSCSPKDAAQAIALADSLFLGGYREEAAATYEAGLQRKPSDEDRAWLLFQTANCKRDTDPDLALGLYRRLQSECPDSPWSKVADVQERLIDWLKVNAPVQALAEALAATKEASPAGQASRATDAGSQQADLAGLRPAGKAKKPNE